MGIPGIFKEIGKGERIALSKLAVEHLERHRRPLRIAIDAAIWSFQHQASQGGKNPALRTLFFRLLKLLALPIHPVFIYDGKNKPLTKRNKSVHSYGSCITNEMSKKMIQAFRFPHHTAPGEAEAECALLQKKGVVDAVLSQDVDAIMFGSGQTLRDWSKEGTRGNKSASHVNILRLSEITERTGLDLDGMILVALLSGGDYNTDGIAGFGPALACEIAKAGFGADLMELVRNNDEEGLHEWRERLQFELETNESGYFRTKHKTLHVPHDFPDRTILSYYTDPAVSKESDLPQIEASWSETWDQDIDIPALRQHVAATLDWQYKSGAKKVIRTLAPALLAHKLRRGLADTTISSIDQIKERRKHFVNDGIPELRLEVIPADIVGLDLAEEEDNPAYVADIAEEVDEDGVAEADEPPSSQVEVEQLGLTQSLSKKRKSSPWDPFAVNKIWIPETIVRFGVPALVDAWHQKQLDILSDPKRYATRNCPTKGKVARKPKDPSMKHGAIEVFCTTSKPAAKRSERVTPKAIDRQPLQTEGNSRQPQTPTKPSRREDNEDESLKVDQYFRHSNVFPQADADRARPGNSDIATASLPKRSSPALYSSDTELTFPTPKKSHLSTRSGDTVQSFSNLPLSQAALVLQPSHSGRGTSITESIHISSSPPQIEPSSSFGTVDTQPMHSSQSLSDLPLTVAVSVTQRKRYKRAGQEIQKSPSATKSKASIESFFGPQKPATSSKEATRSNEAPLLPPEPTTGLKTHFKTSKAVGVPRESLPGTWKELFEADDEAVRSSRRKPRISCIDMSGE